ncbi:hypothetical protein HDE_14281 [Halotydeus destructor]|nr:hypothetical protein HDE_14281 [Halotydeus destructor]
MATVPFCSTGTTTRTLFILFILSWTLTSCQQVNEYSLQHMKLSRDMLTSMLIDVQSISRAMKFQLSCLMETDMTKSTRADYDAIYLKWHNLRIRLNEIQRDRDDFMLSLCRIESIQVVECIATKRTSHEYEDARVVEVEETIKDVAKAETVFENTPNSSGEDFESNRETMEKYNFPNDSISQAPGSTNPLSKESKYEKQTEPVEQFTVNDMHQVQGVDTSSLDNGGPSPSNHTSEIDIKVPNETVLLKVKDNPIDPIIEQDKSVINKLDTDDATEGAGLSFDGQPFDGTIPPLTEDHLNNISKAEISQISRDMSQAMTNITQTRPLKAETTKPNTSALHSDSDYTGKTALKLSHGLPLGRNMSENSNAKVKNKAMTQTIYSLGNEDGPKAYEPTSRHRVHRGKRRRRGRRARKKRTRLNIITSPLVSAFLPSSMTASRPVQPVNIATVNRMPSQPSLFKATRPAPVYTSPRQRHMMPYRQLARPPVPVLPRDAHRQRLGPPGRPVPGPVNRSNGQRSRQLSLPCG